MIKPKKVSAARLFFACMLALVAGAIGGVLFVSTLSIVSGH